MEKARIVLMDEKTGLAGGWTALFDSVHEAQAYATRFANAPHLRWLLVIVRKEQEWRPGKMPTAEMGTVWGWLDEYGKKERDDG